jgi:basic membrane lipoprotein Med (substrate-binding protein (PBP1-ABC) superfamily)
MKEKQGIDRYIERFKGGSSMLKKAFILFPIMLLVAATAFPQGRGGQRGGQQGQRQSQSSGQGSVWGTGQAGGGQMQQKRIHTTQQQQKQINSCNKSADGIQKQARKMSQMSGNKFSLNEASKQHSRMQEQFKAMEQQHQQLMNGLDSGQNQAWQEQISNMNQFRQQANLQLQQMNTELNSSNPDSKKIAGRAREMEQIMNNWRKEYNTMSSQADGF